MLKTLYKITENKKTFNSLIAVVFATKTIFACLFFSDYQNLLFLPFIKHFVNTFDSPWQFFYENPSTADFPYHPLMLYIYSLFLWPFKTLLNHQILSNLLFAIPSILADLGITQILFKLFPHNKLKVVLFYTLSPIIFYGAFLHSQVDLIPTALLFFSVYLITQKKTYLSAIIFGCALATKFHVILALPVLLIYLFKNTKKYISFHYLLISLGVFSFFILPYFSSPGFQSMVLNNPKQMLLYNSFYQIGNFKIYLPLFFATILYARFFAYHKVNRDLLFSYIGIVFLVILILIPPSPAWYIWLFPFISLFLVKTSHSRQILFPLYLVLNILYLTFFLFFHQSGLQDLIFLNTEINLKIDQSKFANIIFTLLEVTLLALIYAFYRFGVKSNQVYLREQGAVIGIGGNSGAGKTTLLKNLRCLLGKQLLEIEGDGEHKWERGDENWQKTTHLDPKANFLHKQADHILKLKKGQSIKRSEYDHSTGKFTEAQKIKPKDYIVICGLHPFYLPKLRRTIDLKIFLDTDPELVKQWKIARDTEKRGYSQEKILKQIKDREKHSQTYIDKQKQFADLIIRFSSTQNDTIPNLLKVTFNSSIHVEDFVYSLEAQGINIDWEYSDDLRTQSICLHDAIFISTIQELIKDYIPNSEEILSEDYQIQEGLNGFLQFIILLLLSHTMQHEV